MILPEYLRKLSNMDKTLSNLARVSLALDFGISSNLDSGGRQLNRRVEIVIGGVDGAPVAARNHP
jgi:outer membrane protein OmpA-like peptidoglycan-associated protein